MLLHDVALTAAAANSPRLLSVDPVSGCSVEYTMIVEKRGETAVSTHTAAVPVAKQKRQAVNQASQ